MTMTTTVTSTSETTAAAAGPPAEAKPAIDLDRAREVVDRF